MKGVASNWEVWREREECIQRKSLRRNEWCTSCLGNKRHQCLQGTMLQKDSMQWREQPTFPVTLVLFNPLVPFRLSLTWCNWPCETVFPGPLDTTPSSLEFILDFLPSNSAFNPSAVWSILSPNKSLFHSLFRHFAYYQLTLSHQLSLPGLPQQSLNWSTCFHFSLPISFLHMLGSRPAVAPD